MSKKNIWVIVGILLLGVFLGYVYLEFFGSPFEKKKIKKEAQSYIDKTFKDDIDIYDILFDNMGNFNFDYAAKAENKKDHTKFLIYYNDEKKMGDSYISEKWERDLFLQIQPVIENKVKHLDGISVVYDMDIGNQYNIDPNNPGSYEDYDASPTVQISISREPNENDQSLLKEIKTTLQDIAKLKHGDIWIKYTEDGVPIDFDTEWKLSF